MKRMCVRVWEKRHDGINSAFQPSARVTTSIFLFNSIIFILNKVKITIRKQW